MLSLNTYHGDLWTFRLGVVEFVCGGGVDLQRAGRRRMGECGSRSAGSRLTAAGLFRSRVLSHNELADSLGGVIRILLLLHKVLGLHRIRRMRRSQKKKTKEEKEEWESSHTDFPFSV